MSKDKPLPLEDVRRVFRLVGECRELGDDVAAWRMHLLEEVARLVGTRVGMSGDFAVGRATDDFALGRATHMMPQFACGWEGDQGTIFHECLSAHVGRDELIWQRAMSDGGIGGMLQTFRRSDYVPDREWYRQVYVQEDFRAADVDRLIFSGRMCPSTDPMLDGLVLMRSWGEKRFSKRECGLVQLLHDEIAPLIGGPLAATGEPAPSDLSPRKQQVLELLLLGATDKQIASSLNVSRPTASEYVTAVVQHFQVRSRSELIALFLKRHRHPRSG